MFETLDLRNGLTAIMIANAVGANVIAIDIAPEKLALARQLGAALTVNGSQTEDTAGTVIELTGGGAHVSLDALGHPDTCYNSVLNLRKRGRHIQVGLMLADQATPRIPMSKVIADELEILGSHGMQAHDYPAMMRMIDSGTLKPEQLITRKISLSETPHELMNMNSFNHVGVTIIDPFQ